MHTISNRLAALATVLAAVAALAGLAVTGLYVDSPNWVQQAQGTDLATLFLAVPVLALGLWTASRGSSAGRLAVVAGLAFVVVRASSFHEVDRLLGLQLAMLRVSHLLELGGIACVGLGAFLAGRAVPASRDVGSPTRHGS